MITLSIIQIVFIALELLLILGFILNYPKTQNDWGGAFITGILTMLQIILIVTYGWIYWW